MPIESDKRGVHQFLGFHDCGQCIHVTAGAFPDFGAGGGWKHGLHVDAFGAEFDMQALSQEKHKSLGRPIDSEPDFRGQPDDRAYVDDSSFAGRRKARRHRVGKPGQRRDVQRDQSREIATALIEEITLGRGACVVDEHANAYVLAQPRLDALKILLLGQIGSQHLDKHTRLPTQAISESLHSGTIVRHQHKIMASTSETVGVDGTNSRRGAGHEHGGLHTHCKILPYSVFMMVVMFTAYMTVIVYAVKGSRERMMRISREQVAENRRTILEAAGRLFRERGFDSVTVAEVMQAAGLTHGGFYGYFKSKDELIAQALAAALQTTAPLNDFAAYAASYLSRTHRDNLTDGCATAALAAETIRQNRRARSEMTTGLKRQIERLTRVTAGKNASQKRRAAIGTWAAMVGAMILARVSDDPALSGEVLDQTRAWLQAQAKNPLQRDSRGSSSCTGIKTLA
jgi:TetR/AcrR family transcriptional regulator, transcriptional repressor for nem operon